MTNSEILSQLSPRVVFALELLLINEEPIKLDGEMLGLSSLGTQNAERALQLKMDQLGEHELSEEEREQIKVEAEQFRQEKTEEMRGGSIDVTLSEEEKQQLITFLLMQEVFLKDQKMSRLLSALVTAFVV